VALDAATDRSEAPAGRTAAVLRRLTGANYGLDWSNSWEALKSRAVWVAQRSMPGPARWLLLLIVPLVVTGLVRTARWSPGTELEFVIMVIAVSCVKLLSAHNSTQHTSRKHKV
jgi:hypothetical protein